MLNKILVANRGEIARRIIKTLKDMGIFSIAIYTSSDQNSVHIREADAAYLIDNYLNIDSIIKIAKLAKVCAIHPGYGFLSENPKFAEAISKTNIVFIGPSPEAIEIMASKQKAKELLEKVNIPLIPGYHGLDQSDQVLIYEAEKIGFPILIKPAAGGGGKGMKLVRTEEELPHALESARREARASFADDILLLEKYLENPRHIEVQIVADNFGNIIHLFERDCSVQRRHQKIIEEAGELDLDITLRNNLYEKAILVAETIKYSNLGTVEFLVDQNNNFYFIEMNTRLQVEHPVTEMITNLDLVKLQIHIAAGEKLELIQKDIKAKGHAIECRIYAEDPENNFMPSTGVIRFIKEPKLKNIRIDSGIEKNSEVSAFYDPMIAKLITWGQTRDESKLRMLQALREYKIAGIKTNIAYLYELLCDNKPDLNLDLILYMAVALDYLINNPPFKNFELFESSKWQRRYIINKISYEISYRIINLNQLEITALNQTKSVTIHNLKNSKLSIEFDNQYYEYFIELINNTMIFYLDYQTIIIERENFIHENLEFSNLNKELTAPMPGTIVAIFKKEGEKIALGEKLIVLEAMKMEHTILAPREGYLKELFCSVGSQVKEGAELALLTDFEE